MGLLDTHLTAPTKALEAFAPQLRDNPTVQGLEAGFTPFNLPVGKVLGSMLFETDAQRQARNQVHSGVPLSNTQRTNALESKLNTVIGSTETPNSMRYPYSVNLSNPEDESYIRRIFSDDTVNDMKNGVFKYGRHEGKSAIEDIIRRNIVSEPFTKPELTIQPYEGARTFYHGTAPENIPLIEKNGFVKGSDLPEDAFRSGGYGKIQHSVSLSSDPHIASRFSGQGSTGGLLKTEVSPSAKIVSIPGIEDATDLNNYADELIKKGIDAAYIGGGEKELVVFNPKMIQPKGSTVFNVKNAKSEVNSFLNTVRPNSSASLLTKPMHPDDLNMLNHAADILGDNAYKGTSQYKGALKDAQALADTYLPTRYQTATTPTLIKLLLKGTGN